MNIVFAGTSLFAAPALEALLGHAGVRVVTVYTQPDRPAGRGKRLRPGAIKELALAHDLCVRQPAHLADEAPHLAALQPDLVVVAAYGLLLPAPLLRLPRLGCINVHASLLPRWRGAAPVLHAIAAGDRETGVTLMQIAAGLDTGDILCQARIAIADDDTRGSLEHKLSALGADLLARSLPDLAALQAGRSVQDDTLATGAPIVRPAAATFNWSHDAASLARRIRALDPQPGARTSYRGAPLKLWRARVAAAGDSERAPGVIISARDELLVQTGNGILSLLRLQRAGGRRLDAASFLNGMPLAAGERLGG